jgi:uncharacterized membrane protein
MPGIRTLTVLFVITLLIRGFSAGLLNTPRALDECCYYSVAVNLVENHSFTSDIKWTYIDGTEFPAPFPSNKFWMPGISILMALSIMLFGKSYMGARVLIIIISSIFPIAVYLFSALFFRDGLRRYAAWFLTLFSPWYFLYWGTMDNFGLYGLTAFSGLAFFYLAAFYMRKSIKHALAVSAFAGLFSGAAHLCRADGGLVVASGIIFNCIVFLPGILKGLFDKTASGKSVSDAPGPDRSVSAIAFLGLCTSAVIGYLLVMGPWFYRNHQVFGQIMPKEAKNAIFLRHYNQMFHYLTCLPGHVKRPYKDSSKHETHRVCQFTVTVVFDEIFQIFSGISII